ncbi:MAG: hypothetical protein PHS33_09010, partial [Candidatus Omnitrophica bacterium]|nr:hypothetical protein [Candidatus Omnitrophota bacterium]
PKLLCIQYVPDKSKTQEQQHAEIGFLQLAANSTRPLTEKETVDKIRDILEKDGISVREVAEKTGYSESWIKARLTVAAAPTEVRTAVESGNMSRTAAVEFTRAPEEKKKNLIEKTKSGKKVRVADVQIEVKGHAAQIPSRHVEEMIRVAAANYSALKDTDLIEADKWFFVADILRKVVNQENIELVHKPGE